MYKTFFYLYNKKKCKSKNYIAKPSLFVGESSEIVY